MVDYAIYLNNIGIKDEKDRTIIVEYVKKLFEIAMVQLNKENKTIGL